VSLPAQIWRNGRGIRFLIPVAVLLGSLLILGEVIDEVREGERQHWDEQALRMLRSADDPSKPIGPHWLRIAALDLTALGGGAVLTLLTLIVLGYLILERRLHAAIFLVVAALGGTMLNNVLKKFFGRERPSIVPHLSEVSSSSFPSGHSMLSAIIYLTLGVMLARTVKDWRLRSYFLSVALALTVTIGLTRMYLGVHYPSDVLAGWMAGIAYALLCFLVAAWLQHLGVLRPASGGDRDDPPGER
jgi:Membrane-associated phospholipid phosphatase